VAEEVAAFKNRLSGVEAKLLLLTWMVGHLAITIVLLERGSSADDVDRYPPRPSTCGGSHDS
jgi:hypothetical protein